MKDEELDQKYGVQMSPQDARAWTLREISDFCDEKLRECEGDGNGGLVKPETYFAIKEVKDKCQTLINEIKFS